MELTDLTIEQFMYVSLLIETYKDNENKLKQEIIKYIYKKDVGSVSNRDADKTIQSIFSMLQDKPNFIQRFIYQGVEYGFIPNLDDISTGEFCDLDDYLSADEKQLNRIAAILYRPITKSLGNMYQIEPYEGTAKYSETMKGVSYKTVMGAVVFFWNLSKSLLEASNIYIQKEVKNLTK